tara:strand:+ start:6729 stop:7784 length:1056 start_codon:yes stop_codon:yes gene_type:complete
MKFLSIIFFFIVLTPTQLLTSQDYLTKPKGCIRNLEPEEIKQHEKSGGYYNEFWNYHIALDNGSEIYLNYSISHFGGVRDAVTGARLSLLNWYGKNYKAAREYDLDKLVFDEETYRFFLNPERGIWYEGKLPDRHKVHYKTNKNGIQFDINLDFKDIEPGFTWGSGLFKMGENDLAGMYTQIPSSKIEGFIALDYDTVYVSGTATMTQIHQTNVGTRLFEKSFRYIKRTNNGYLGGYFLIPKDSKTEIVGYAYEKKNGSVILKKPISIKYLETKKYKEEKISSRIEICYINTACDIIEVTAISEKITMLDELGGLKKIFAKRFLGGDIIELRGSAMLNKNQPVYYSLTILD